LVFADSGVLPKESPWENLPLSAFGFCGLGSSSEGIPLGESPPFRIWFLRTREFFRRNPLGRISPFPHLVFADSEVLPKESLRVNLPFLAKIPNKRNIYNDQKHQNYKPSTLCDSLL